MRFTLREPMQIAGRRHESGATVDLAALIADESVRARVAAQIEAGALGVRCEHIGAQGADTPAPPADPLPVAPETAADHLSKPAEPPKRAKRAKG